ncbi:MAG: helix-turn-helix domain-containing protein [Rhodospirillales bacterium]
MTPYAPSLLNKYKLLEMALRDPRLGHSVTPRSVLQVLIEHDGPAGCFPGKSRIARLCRKDISNVNNALKLLRKCGYIDWDKVWDTRQRRWRTNRYRINYLADSPNNALSDKEEELALDELAQCIQEQFSLDCITAYADARAIRDYISSDVSVEKIGRALWKVVRDVQRKPEGGETLDNLIREARLKPTSD